MATKEKRQPNKKVPRKATPRHLENAALHYLSRFATSAENLKRVLMRKVARSAYYHDTDAEEGGAVVEDLIRRFLDSSLLDDGVYAKARAASLHQRGNSERQIRAKLQQKGVGNMDIDEALEALGETKDAAELEAARTYARRRRFGPFATKKLTPEAQEKQLAAMARAGFSYGVAKQVLDN